MLLLLSLTVTKKILKIKDKAIYTTKNLQFTITKPVFNIFYELNNIWNT